MIHRFSFINQIPLNASNQDLLINFIEYWEVTPDKIKHFSWLGYRFYCDKRQCVSNHARWAYPLEDRK
jgi:hypothetical protein